LFYTCGACARQLSEREFLANNWGINQKPAIALQILGYQTNRIHGLTAEVGDTSVDKVNKNHLPKEKFMNH
jgi:hypothetical protein